MLRLRELKEMVAVADVKRERVPSPKALSEKSRVVVKEIMKDGGEITVYENGYVHYRNSDRETVFALHEYEGYEYDLAVDASDSKLSEEFFENEAWYLRLVLVGEDRITKNWDDVHSKACVSYSAEAEDWKALADEEDALECFLKDEFWRIMQEQTDERQWKSFCDVYMHGENFTDIGKRLGISRQCATRLVQRTMKRIRSALLEEGYGKN